MMDNDDSIDNSSSIIDTASRQRVRGEQSYAQLDSIGNSTNDGGEDSPSIMERGTQDPPEEMEYYSTQNSASTRGIDPEEEEDALRTLRPMLTSGQPGNSSKVCSPKV